MIELGFGSDNHSGIHPQILEALMRANAGHSPSYGTDSYTQLVIEKLKDVFGQSADIHFVFNGTAANVLCLKALLKRHEAVICAETAHLNLDECGAPESAIGCKVLTVPSKDGKITFQQIERFLIRKGDQHYAQPRVLSITLPTEYGTVYSLEELRELRALTREHGLYIHIDGARLPYALIKNNCRFYDLSEGLSVDAISLGGTKNGLLFGEACVIFNKEAKKDFKFLRKQSMQLPSKMRFIAAQFEALYLTPLHKELSTHCHQLALYLSERLKEVKDVLVTQKVEANSVFAIIPKAWTKELRKNHFFYIWDEETWEVRLMITYDTTKEKIDQFINDILRIKNA
jgi:threonine aldolase